MSIGVAGLRGINRPADSTSTRRGPGALVVAGEEVSVCSWPKADAGIRLCRGLTPPIRTGYARHRQRWLVGGRTPLNLVRVTEMTRRSDVWIRSGTRVFSD